LSKLRLLPLLDHLVAEPRQPLLLAVRSFVHSARDYPGVLRIALLGSLTTTKLIPKDVDVLVTIDGAVELVELARTGRRLQGVLKPSTLVPTFFLLTKMGATSVGSAIIASAFHARHASRKIAAVASTSTTIFKSSHSRRSHCAARCGNTPSDRLGTSRIISSSCFG